MPRNNGTQNREQDHGIPKEKDVLTCFECYDDAKPDKENVNNKTTQFADKRTHGVIENIMKVTTDCDPCPMCGGREATCEIRQMDETYGPEVVFLEFQICNHGWRD